MVNSKENVEVKFEGQVTGNKNKTNVFTKMLKSIVRNSKGKVDVQENNVSEE